VKPLEYSRPESVAEAIRQHGGNPEAKFLAGGSNLVDLMKYGVEQPTVIVDVARLPLSRIEAASGGGLRIGALVRNSDCAMHKRVRQDYPALSEAILAGASPQLRNMATTGGNLLQRTRCGYFYDTAFPCNKRQPGTGCPAIEGSNRMHAVLGQSDHCIAVYPSDMAVALALYDAIVHVEGPDGKRSIKIQDFHRLPGDTPQIDNTLKEGELITDVELPKAPPMKATYLKVRDRASYAFALVSVAAGLQIHDGTIREARIALGGVAAKPWRVSEPEALLSNKKPSRQVFQEAAEAALVNARGYKHNEFKIELAKRSIVSALEALSA
jgi:xanthine dehydrogenase YagS FAD-binding subunit